MIGHVYKRVKLCKNLKDVYVATCDIEIYDYILSIGGKCILTKDSHERATDRTAEAFKKIYKKDKEINDILMVQGDEPLVDPSLLDKMIFFHLNQHRSFITNLISKINNQTEFNNSNIVKVVKSNSNRILYMSRAKIPSDIYSKSQVPMWKQLGLIIFSKNSLNKYIDLSPTKLEVLESIDMNRILENDFEIIGYETNKTSHAVDVPDDITIVESLLDNDKYFNRYS